MRLHQYDFNDPKLGHYRLKKSLIIRHPITADIRTVHEGTEMVAVGNAYVDLSEGESLLITFAECENGFPIDVEYDEVAEYLEPLFHVPGKPRKKVKRQ